MWRADLDAMFAIREAQIGILLLEYNGAAQKYLNVANRIVKYVV